MVSLLLFVFILVFGCVVNMIVNNIISSGSDFGVIVIADELNCELTKSCIDKIKLSEGIFYDLVVIESKGDEFYFGKSVSAGMDALKYCNHVVVMDNDTFIDKDALKIISDYMYSHPNVGYCGGWKYDKKGRLVWIGGVHRGYLIQYLLECTLEGSPLFAIRRILKGGNYSYGVRGVNKYIPGKMVAIDSQFCCVNRKCYVEIGGWDEDYRASYVACDFSYRVILTDRWYISSCPAKYQHIGMVTRRKYPEWEFEFNGLPIYLSKWSKKKIEEVIEAGKKGKFLWDDKNENR